MEPRTNDEDVVTVIMILLSTGMIGGLSLVGFLKPIQEWAIAQGLLLPGDLADVRFPWDPSIGLDWGRILIAGGVVALAIVGALFALVRRNRRRTTVD